MDKFSRQSGGVNTTADCQADDATVWALMWIFHQLL